MYWIGYDIGSSSIKAALVAAETGQTLGVAQSPPQELAIAAPQPDWAEQDPAVWWIHLIAATQQLLASTGVPAEAIVAVGIAYQMHGLVLIDEHQEVLRPAIIWCDSRAVAIGQEAFTALGSNFCLSHLLNSPGNFTAAKLRWVQVHEPEVFARVRHFLLPGDYVAMRLSGRVSTTITGLSEAMLWDFSTHGIAQFLLDHWQLSETLVPPVVPIFGEQGRVSAAAAAATGLPAGIPITYRAGDQPNNALALGVLEPGELAGTGGTSGVVYAVLDQPIYDPLSRVNGFAHVNHQPERPRIGQLLCINGAGIQYSWLRRMVQAGALDYAAMEALASTVPVGAAGLMVHSFGNGAERMLENRQLGAQVSGLNFNRHQEGHLVRATLEGLAFAFAYGVAILQTLGVAPQKLRVGNDNLFRSAIFSETLATLLNCRIEVMETTGAAGAARGAGLGLAGGTPVVSPQHLPLERVYHPAAAPAAYQEAYAAWCMRLNQLLTTSI